MRPIKLVMSAFGPFSGEETVDFSKLGKSGIYLITGDTGSGKTTIFDAITYALYGAGTGNRDIKDMRCKFADPKAVTCVKLWFDEGGAEYYIERTPSYERKAKRNRHDDAVGEG